MKMSLSLEYEVGCFFGVVFFRLLQACVWTG